MDTDNTPMTSESSNPTLSRMDTRCTFTATVRLDEPVRILQTAGWNSDSAKRVEYEVTEVRVVWAITLTDGEARGSWYPMAKTKGRRVLKSGALSAHSTSLYGNAVTALEKAAIEASTPKSTPSITWSN